MPAEICVIGIGQPIAGDDGVGIAVARKLRKDGCSESVKVYEISDPSQLIHVVNRFNRIILIDAVLGNGEPGHIACLTADSLARAGVTPVSSHGISIARIINLARTLAPHTPTADIHIVGITIKQPKLQALEMSPPIRAAVPRAAAVILEMLKDYA